MLLSLVTYAIVRRRRDFASVTQFAADHYEVTVLSTSLGKARQVLGANKVAPVRPRSTSMSRRVTVSGSRPVRPLPLPLPKSPSFRRVPPTRWPSPSPNRNPVRRRKPGLPLRRR